MAKPSQFVSRCKGGPARRRKLAGRRHCLAASPMGRLPSEKAGGGDPRRNRTPGIGGTIRQESLSSPTPSRHEEPRGIVGVKLILKP